MNASDCYQLTNPQQRIWLTELLNDSLDMSNIGYLIEMKGRFDLQRLAQSIKHVVKANDGLQLRFKFADKEKSSLLQYIPEYEEMEVGVIHANSKDELFHKINEIHRQRFNVTDKNLCAFYVFSINDEKFGFFEKAHHLVADGISATVVGLEIVDVYEKLTNNTFESLEKDASYIDFIKDEQDYIQSDKYAKSKQYWLDTFKDYEGEEIDFQLNKNKINSMKVNRCNQYIPDSLTAILDAYKVEKRLSYFGLFMAAMAVYFNRYFNHEDMIIGMPVHNRSKKVFKKMVGMFVSTLPFRIKFEENWSFNDLIAYVKSGLWDSLKHQSYPFNHLVKNLKDMGMATDGLLNVQLIELPPGAKNDAIDTRAFFSTAFNISQPSIYLN
ncbi:MAG: hypothetical protein GY765_22225, partial [bacterium]|nr:hypothetical protein [bacterium]